MRIIFALAFTIGLQSVSWARVSFVCQNPNKVSSSWSGANFSLSVSQECEALIQARGDFKSSGVASVFLDYILSAPTRTLASEGALPQNGYEKKYNTQRTENNSVGNLSIEAEETLREYPERVLFQNKSTKISGNGLAGNLISTDVSTELKVVQKPNGLLAIKYTSLSSGVINKPFLIPSGFFSSTVESTVTSELSKRTNSIIKEIESHL